jgi:ribonucleoside-diphosphate reductase alpha chain
MRVFDRSCETVESAGARRGAQMAVLRCDHPDIEEFIHAKDHGRAAQLQHLSVGVSDTRSCRRCRTTHRSRTGQHRAEPGVAAQKNAGAQLQQADGNCGCTASVPARALWDQIMQATYDHAEPGVLFLDRINRDNNLARTARPSPATNPCAEQPLPPYGCCCLGSVNLTRFVRHALERQRQL